MMSMWPRKSYEIPVQTVQVAHTAFPKGTLAIRVRDAVGEVFSDAQFGDLFGARGHPALSPARLVMVTVLQYSEGLSDRQAADAVRGRLDWKYCLGLELTDPGFDASVLSEFRARLVAGHADERLLGRMLEVLRERGLLAGGGRQRTDSTHVLAAVRALSNLELVVETMRAALEALAVAAPDWLAGIVEDDWWERYEQRASDYRLPRAEAAREEQSLQVGKDGFRLLEAIWSPAAPYWLRQMPAADVLRRVWVQRFLRTGTVVQRRTKGDEPPGALRIGSPYDTQARYGHKRGHGWFGYKAHVTEVCTPGRPQVIVHVATTEASLADVETVADRHTGLAEEGLTPAEHLADAGYISVGHILTAAAEHNIALVGPLPSDSHWQARDPDAYDLSHFTVDWDARQVTCPQGKTARAWRNDVSRDGLPVIHVAFPPTGCFRCPDRPRCTKANAVGRSLTLRPRAQYEAQHRIRAEQTTDTWKKLYAQRSGVEGAIAQASRRSNIHQARYRGLDRIHLQHTLTALALNIVRVDAWLNGLTPAGSWTTKLTHFHRSLTAGAL